jgi:peptide methionine sulfoxide reductase MsrA
VQIITLRTQYRSAIFAYSPEQKHIAQKILDEVQEKHFKGRKIVVRQPNFMLFLSE